MLRLPIRHGANWRAEAARLAGARIFFDYPSVLGTVNVLFAAVLAQGELALVHDLIRRTDAGLLSIHGLVDAFPTEAEGIRDAIDRLNPERAWVPPTLSPTRTMEGDAVRFSSALMRSRCFREEPVVPTLEAKLVDDEGRDLPADPDVTGILCVRGSVVIKGYLNRPEATADSIRDGWLNTGDIARIDADGFVYIVDRAKDMVLRGGENVYCSEVEAAIYLYDAVAEAMQELGVTSEQDVIVRVMQEPKGGFSPRPAIVEVRLKPTPSELPPPEVLEEQGEIAADFLEELLSLLGVEADIEDAAHRIHGGLAGAPWRADRSRGASAARGHVARRDTWGICVAGAAREARGGHPGPVARASAAADLSPATPRHGRGRQRAPGRGNHRAGPPSARVHDDPRIVDAGRGAGIGGDDRAPETRRDGGDYARWAEGTGARLFARRRRGRAARAGSDRDHVCDRRPGVGAEVVGWVHDPQAIRATHVSFQRADDGASRVDRGC